MVRLGSWLITDMTMLIMTCSLLIFLASSWISSSSCPAHPGSLLPYGPRQETC